MSKIDSEIRCIHGVLHIFAMKMAAISMGFPAASARRPEVQMGVKASGQPHLAMGV